MVGRKDGRTLKVEVVGDIKDIKKDVAEVNKTIGGLTKTAKNLGTVMVAGFAVSEVVDFAKGAIGAASDLQESMSKVGVVFGDTADDIERWSRSSATSIGLSQQKALEAAGTFGNLFDAIGLTEKATLDMSKGAVQLAADLASFNNANVEDVLLAIRSGLLGEAEPMRQFGASLSEARVQAFGLENGLGEMVKTGKTVKFVMSDADKMTARYQLILSDTANAQGDFARTADGLANKQRILDANIQNVTASLGALMIGPADAFVGWLNDLVGAGGSSGFMQSLNRQLEIMAENAGKVADAGPKEGDWLLSGTIFDSAADGMSSLNEATLDFLQTTDDWVKPVQTNLGMMANATEEELYRAAKAVMDMGGTFEDFQRILANKAAAGGATAVFDGLSKAAAGAIGIWDRAASGVDTSTDEIVTHVASVSRVSRQVPKEVAESFIELPKSIKAAKAPVRRAMAELEWALKNPLDSAELGDFYDSKLKAAYRKLRQAQRTGNARAIALARQLIADLKGEMNQLNLSIIWTNAHYGEGKRGAMSKHHEGGGRTGRNASQRPGSSYRPGDGGVEGSHAMGLDRVPHDNYLANLHKDEAVLDAPDAAAWRAGQSGGSVTNVSITVNAPVAADGFRVGKEIAAYLDDFLGGGGRFRYRPVGGNA